MHEESGVAARPAPRLTPPTTYPTANARRKARRVGGHSETRAKTDTPQPGNQTQGELGVAARPAPRLTPPTTYPTAQLTKEPRRVGGRNETRAKTDAPQPQHLK